MQADKFALIMKLSDLAFPHSCRHFTRTASFPDLRWDLQIARNEIAKDLTRCNIC